MAKTIRAKITPATITKGDTSRGARYSVMKGATIEKRGPKGKPMTETRTVMAFGEQNRAVANILRPGKTIDVLIQYTGGSVKIVGRAPAQAA